MRYQYNTDDLKVINQATLIEEAEVEMDYFLPFENQNCGSIEKAVYELIDRAAIKDSEEESLIYLAKVIALLKEPYIIDIFEYAGAMGELNKIREQVLNEIRDITFNTSMDY